MFFLQLSTQTKHHIKTAELRPTDSCVEVQIDAVRIRSPVKVKRARPKLWAVNERKHNREGKSASVAGNINKSSTDWMLTRSRKFDRRDLETQRESLGLIKDGQSGAGPRHTGP